MFFGYDVETYPNIFTCALRQIDTEKRWFFEISERRNDLPQFLEMLFALRNNHVRLVGFNNVGFDWVVVNFILDNQLKLLQLSTYECTLAIWQKAQEIFNSSSRFAHRIWRPSIAQVDLFLIHHFDNMAKSTGLKMLEYNMCSENIRDLPFEPNTHIPLEGIPILVEYNMHDVNETCKFFQYSRDLVSFRDELTEKYGRDFTNHNDTKIGKDYFIMQLEAHNPQACYYQDADNFRQPRQTSRPSGVKLDSVIFDYINFDQPEFNRILTWMKQQTLHAKDFENTSTVGIKTKGVFTDVHCVIDGFRYDFGTGGIHGSITGQAIREDKEFAVVDWDVASYYPNMAIVNRLFPEHLGEAFCDIYKDVYEQRKQHKKGTAPNAMLKLALNGVYGDSNNIYSPFFDPKYTMSITINGQLLLCKLAEMFLTIPKLSLIQINTDGLTVKVPHEYVILMEQMAREWEKLTGLVLEDVPYSVMFIRDVNNYIAVDKDGKIKTKGAYESKAPQDRNPLGWHQNLGGLVIPKAAQEYLVNGTPIEKYIVSSDRNAFDFCLRTKVPRNCKLVLVDANGNEEQQQRITRYFVAREGRTLTKLSPPPAKYKEGWYKRANGVSEADYFKWMEAWGDTWNPEIHTKNKSKYQTRRDTIEKGWFVEECNDITTANWTNINYEYYCAEAHKLVDCIKC